MSENSRSYISPQMVRDALANTPQVTFEVTNACNLNCFYCAYGTLYGDYGSHGSQFLSVDRVRSLIDYLAELWQSDANKSYSQNVYISFYGGEPLLNSKLIRWIVNYIESLYCPTRLFTFGMTTNALLIPDNIDFLVEHRVRLLISLDGDRQASSYRTDVNGNDVFDRIIQNVELIQNDYPEYFRDCVSFNAVLHNRNSVPEILRFFDQRFGKIPSIGELNGSGVAPNMQQVYNKIYRSKSESYDNEALTPKVRSMDDPMYHAATLYLMANSPFAYSNYNELIYGKTIAVNNEDTPCATCVPFSRKVYVTVSGDILPCERISPRFSLGRITEDFTCPNYQLISDIYNDYYCNMSHQCRLCYHRKNCTQCMFYIKGLGTEKYPRCHQYMSEKEELQYVSDILIFLRDHPEVYMQIMTDTLIK